jgi:GNAT superfamily N-acetyltransferase
MALKFRIAKEDDLNHFDDIRGEKLHKLHLKRITLQKEGKGEYIIAFENNGPVGHIFVNYKNSNNKYPVLEDLYVKEIERGKGIAKKILIYIEKRLKKQKYKEIGIDVETHELWIKKFYESLGYVLVGGPDKSTFRLEDKNKDITEITFHLKKKV